MVKETMVFKRNAEYLNDEHLNFESSERNSDNTK